MPMDGPAMWKLLSVPLAASAVTLYVVSLLGALLLVFRPSCFHARWRSRVIFILRMLSVCLYVLLHKWLPDHLVLFGHVLAVCVLHIKWRKSLFCVFDWLGKNVHCPRHARGASIRSSLPWRQINSPAALVAHCAQVDNPNLDQ